MLTLYGMGSPNVIKIFILLEELKEPYEFVRVDVVSGEQFEAPFVRLNPNSKVPVLVDEDQEDTVIVFESGAILQYLAEKNDYMWPKSFHERTEVNTWLLFQMANLGPISGQAIHFNFVTKEDSYARTRFNNELKRLLFVVEKRLEISEFIAGTTYSIADIALIPWIATLRRFFGEAVEKPHINRWYQSVTGRPAVRRALTIAERLSSKDMKAIRLADQHQRDRYFGRIVSDSHD